LYITLLFAIAAKFNFYLWWQYIKNTLPAAILGFSTMSSLIAMPLTMNATTKNTNSQDFSRLIIPTTVNIHTIGLAINIPLIALSILSNFDFKLPDFITYSEFAFYFVLAQFGVAAIPGCGILLMIPLLEKYLGFTDNMSALITAIYILFDPAETSTNILGNSALAILLSKYKKLFVRN
jgi:Na+/H+-dicarboxylate symporter